MVRSSSSSSSAAWSSVGSCEMDAPFPAISTATSAGVSSTRPWLSETMQEGAGRRVQRLFWWDGDVDERESVEERDGIRDLRRAGG